ncbi:hypothetical protein LT679_06990 [Mucilaginibacter roseus]|uniref:Uncharacterized protein n=1 Tax=Mucilaginibacter roseus TaxID=1528868 RepID=A0ABS8U2M4_9SPHI|nr:hypothetical protein [Mucilaginibacter roseus]MCD8740345.1 hypothetical protein [Mucilaginibacter roseus]
MYIAYLSPDFISTQACTEQQPEITTEDFAIYNERIDGYSAACARLSREIAAIQRYLPGWLPERPGLK